MNKIGSFEDFRHFAVDKTNAKASVLDEQFKNMVYPTVIEERDSAMRVSEINVFSRLIQDRILFLSGEVDSLSMDTLIAQLLYLNSVDNRDISLYINSGGGSVVSGLSLIDTMNYIESDIATTCMGMAASMGAVLLSNGTKGKRFVLPHSRVMVHSVSSGFQGHTADIKIEMEQTIRCQNDIYHILSENCGKSFEEIEHLCDRDKWYIGQEAVEDLGIADKVLIKSK
jgi:ATP-dependent Clp protease protease subunit